MRRILLTHLTPTARMGMLDGADGDRPAVEPGLPRALALLLLVSMTAMAMMVVLVSPPAQAATYTVTNTNDSGAGSLRQAIR